MCLKKKTALLLGEAVAEKENNVKLHTLHFETFTSGTYPWSFVTQIFHNGRPKLSK